MAPRSKILARLKKKLYKKAEKVDIGKREAVQNQQQNDFRSGGVRQVPNGASASDGFTLLRPVRPEIGKGMGYRSLDENFWRSPKVRALTDQGKLAYAFLITQGRLTGIIYRPPEELAAAIGWPLEKWQEILQELITADRVSIGYPHLIWVENHVDHQFLTPGKRLSPKLSKGILRELSELPQGNISKAFIKKYGERLKYPTHRVSARERKSGNEPERVNENDINTNTSCPKFSDEVTNLVNLLCSKMLTNDAKAKCPPLSENGHQDPKWQKWAKEADLLLRVDQRDFKEAEQLIHWCQDNQFWKTNILSMAKFRLQYPQLRLKFKAEQNWQPPETDDDRLARLKD